MKEFMKNEPIQIAQCFQVVQFLTVDIARVVCYYTFYIDLYTVGFAFYLHLSRAIYG